LSSNYRRNEVTCVALLCKHLGPLDIRSPPATVSDCPAWQRRASTCGRALLPHADKHKFLYVLVELCKSEAKRAGPHRPLQGTVLRGSVELPLAGVYFFLMRTNTCLFMCLNSVRARRSGRAAGRNARPQVEALRSHAGQSLRQSVGLLGRVFIPSQGRYLHKHRINTYKHPCLSGILTNDPSV
jgi:hypothetical protein